MLETQILLHLHLICQWIKLERYSLQRQKETRLILSSVLHQSICDLKDQFQGHFVHWSYIDLIDWKKTMFSEPPLTLSLTDNEVQSLIKTPLSCPNYLCHTQPIECVIKLVTEGACSVIFIEAQDGYICQKNPLKEKSIHRWVQVIYLSKIR